MTSKLPHALSPKTTQFSFPEFVQYFRSNPSLHIAEGDKLTIKGIGDHLKSAYKIENLSQSDIDISNTLNHFSQIIGKRFNLHFLESNNPVKGYRLLINKDLSIIPSTPLTIETVVTDVPLKLHHLAILMLLGEVCEVPLESTQAFIVDDLSTQEKQKLEKRFLSPIHILNSRLKHNFLQNSDVSFSSGEAYTDDNYPGNLYIKSKSPFSLHFHALSFQSAQDFRDTISRERSLLLPPGQSLFIQDPLISKACKAYVDIYQWEVSRNSTPPSTVFMLNQLLLPLGLSIMLSQCEDIECKISGNKLVISSKLGVTMTAAPFKELSTSLDLLNHSGWKAPLPIQAGSTLYVYLSVKDYQNYNMMNDPQEGICYMLRKNAPLGLEWETLAFLEGKFKTLDTFVHRLEITAKNPSALKLKPNSIQRLIEQVSETCLPEILDSFLNDQDPKTHQLILLNTLCIMVIFPQYYNNKDLITSFFTQESASAFLTLLNNKEFRSTLLKISADPDLTHEFFSWHDLSLASFKELLTEVHQNILEEKLQICFSYLNELVTQHLLHDASCIRNLEAAKANLSREKEALASLTDQIENLNLKK